MAPDTLADLLATGRTLLLDAAMGTELTRRAAGRLTRGPAWSARALLEAPGLVAAIHRENVAAGADVLTANTFRAHARSLASVPGPFTSFRECTSLAVSLARSAARGAGRPVLVAGSLAPLEDCYRPDLAPPDAELLGEHAALAGALAEAGCDLILLETHNTLREALAAARAAGATGLPYLVSFVAGAPGCLLSGERLAEAARALLSLPVPPALLGVNCVPARVLAPQLAALGEGVAGRVPLLAYGNTGLPLDELGERYTEPIDPPEYAGLAAAWAALGARLVGGCCGTTAAHTAALAGARAAARPAP